MSRPVDIYLARLRTSLSERRTELAVQCYFIGKIHYSYGWNDVLVERIAELEIEIYRLERRVATIEKVAAILDLDVCE